MAERGESAPGTEPLESHARLAEETENRGAEFRGASSAIDVAELGLRLARLEDEVARLRSTVERLLGERGSGSN